jgi:RDD family
MNKILVLIIIIALFAISITCSNGKISYTFYYDSDFSIISIHSSLVATVISAILIVFALTYPLQNVEIDNLKYVEIKQRLFAFIIDYTIIIVALVPLTSLPMLITEKISTGAFTWSFDRNFTRGGDLILNISGTLFLIFAIYYYFNLQHMLGRPTVGQYVSGYRVIKSIDKTKKPNFCLRTTYALIGISIWPISLYLATKRPDRSFWWDHKSNTSVVRVINLPK